LPDREPAETFMPHPRYAARLFPLALFILLMLPLLAQATPPSTTLGVFAYRDAATVDTRFAPVADAMQWALPGQDVRMETLSLEALDTAIAEGRVDFILTNPRHFLAVRQDHAVSGALATLKHYQGGRSVSSLAGVILVPERSTFEGLEDLQGADIGVPGKRFLGGFLTQAYEIDQHGFDATTFADYRELGSHDAVISALLSGDVEAGFVRSGIVEDWLAQGRLQPGQLSVIEAHPTDPDFPLAHSTRLYPEWALAAMPHVPMEDIRRVSNALLQLHGVLPADGHSVAFDPPQDYLPVELAARELGVAPFAPEDMTLWQQLKQRFGKGVWLILGLIGGIVLAVPLLVVLYLRTARLFQRFNALFYYSPSAKLLLHINEHGQPVIADSNLAASCLFGVRSPKALMGKTILDLSPKHQPDGQLSEQRIHALMEGAACERQQFYWQHLDSQGAPIQTEATLLRFNPSVMMDKLESAPTYLVALHNITQQAKEHAELEAERNALKNIIWGTGAGTWEWNVQTDETRFNERWAEMVGYQLAEISPTSIDTWVALCHPDDLPYAEAVQNDHLAGKRDAYDVEVRMRHRDDSWIWIQSRGQVVAWDSEGNPLWMAGTHSDITARKEAEAQAQAAIDQMRRHSALLPGMLYQFWQHPDGRYTFPYAGKGIKENFGLSPEEVREDASRAFSLIDKADLQQVLESIQYSAAQLTTWHTAYRINHPRGHQLWVEGIATPERLEDGSTLWHGYIRDITDEHATRLELEQYRESLERSNKELEHFAYAASHDLRQPLRMVTSYAQLLEHQLGDDLDEDTSTMLHYMRDGAQRMDSMLLSLLDYSRVGRKGQPMQVMALKEAIDEALHFLTPAIQDAGAHFNIDDEWPQVYASPDEMTRLFQNLIGNALKYRAPDQNVVIGLHVAHSVNAHTWQVTVSDNGIGIAPEQQDRLFKVFQRLHTREQYEGTGVGLAICRKIVERHGGEIWVESEGENQGSRFILTLPKQPSDRDDR
ncbi:MAG: PhnD/SsuA/transferrin family substrate-binding protein, partial [Pseudomonadota bacterium]